MLNEYRLLLSLVSTRNVVSGPDANRPMSFEELGCLRQIVNGGNGRSFVAGRCDREFICGVQNLPTTVRRLKTAQIRSRRSAQTSQALLVKPVKHISILTSLRGVAPSKAGRKSLDSLRRDESH